jgi:hypothetical protein
MKKTEMRTIIIAAAMVIMLLAKGGTELAARTIQVYHKPRIDGCQTLELATPGATTYDNIFFACGNYYVGSMTRYVRPIILFDRMDFGGIADRESIISAKLHFYILHDETEHGETYTSEARLFRINEPSLNHDNVNLFAALTGDGGDHTVIGSLVFHDGMTGHQIIEFPQDSFQSLHHAINGTDCTIGIAFYEFKGNDPPPYWCWDYVAISSGAEMVKLEIEIISEPRTIYVDADASGANDGSSWADAYNYLQDALVYASSNPEVNEVWVAAGIYTPDKNSNNPGGSGDRTETFRLIKGVSLYGGYAGFGASEPNERDVEGYETILSGDLNGDDGPSFANYDENSYHVVTGSATDETAVLDGFIITGGNAQGTEYHQRDGRGMYVYKGSALTVRNCRFIGNIAGEGGSLYIGGMVMLTNCTFSDNWDYGDALARAEERVKAEAEARVEAEARSRAEAEKKARAYAEAAKTDRAPRIVADAVDIGVYVGAVLSPQQIVINRIEKATAEKIEALQKINAAIEKKWEAYDALDQMLESGDYVDWRREDILIAKLKIYTATRDEQSSNNVLKESINKLEGSLSVLGYEVKPDVDNNSETPDLDTGTSGTVSLSPHKLAIVSIEEAIAEEAGALEKIDTALEKEKEAYDAFEQMLESGAYGDWKGEDILRAKLKVYIATWHGKYSKNVLKKSVDKLEDSLSVLGVEPGEGNASG